MHESLFTRELSAIGYLCHEEEYAVAAIGDTSVRLLVFHKNKAYKETESRHHHHHPSVISVASFQGPGPPVCYILSTARGQYTICSATTGFGMLIRFLLRMRSIHETC